MKNKIGLLINIIILVVFCFVMPILAQGKQFSIRIDSSSYYSDIPMKIIDNNTYVQLRPFCEELGFDVEWNDRGVIQIDTLKRDFNQDNDIGKDVAMMIGSAVLDTKLSEEFLSVSEIRIREYEEYYSVFRYIPDIDGGGLEIKIRKYDGKLLNIVPGE